MHHSLSTLGGRSILKQMTRSIINPATGLKHCQVHGEVHRLCSKYLSVQQHGTLMEIKKHIIKMIKATHMGVTFMVTAHIACQQILNDTGGIETDFS
jgi:hypothetical protein